MWIYCPELMLNGWHICVIFREEKWWEVCILILFLIVAHSLLTLPLWALRYILWIGGVRRPSYFCTSVTWLEWGLWPTHIGQLLSCANQLRDHTVLYSMMATPPSYDDQWRRQSTNQPGRHWRMPECGFIHRFFLSFNVCSWVTA